ncbi:MAG: hypothetical protein ACRDLF_14055 [Solirubrobacteraceae bacterium]
MASDLIAEGTEPEAGSPESMLQFLAEHTESSRRRRDRKHRGRPRGRKTALLLAIVAALAALGTGLLLWGNSSHRVPGAQTPRAPAKAAAGGSARAGAAPKASKAPAPAATSERWHKGLHPYADPSKQGLPNLYYEWMPSHVSCPGYATYGCWKAKVVTRLGCPHGITVLFQETRDGAVVGLTTGQSRPLRAKTPGVVEVDANQQHVNGRPEWMACN